MDRADLSIPNRLVVSIKLVKPSGLARLIKLNHVVSWAKHARERSL